MPSKEPHTTARAVFAISVTLLLASVATQPAQAQTFKVLHTFHGAPSDGEAPLGVLIRDTAGNLYGTTTEGGTGKCGTTGCGTAFKLNKAGKLVWLHSFNGKNGEYPFAGLYRDLAGNLYGTTVEGGDTTCFSLGCGTVFKLNGAGREALLYSFTGSPDGEMPEALLVGDAGGNLYGTTYSGGTSEYGTVFELSASGTETILHSFAGPPDGGGDGADAYAGVIRDASGNLYGVTDSWRCLLLRDVYEIDAAGTETLLYSFTGFPDGDGPLSVLLMDPEGNLYGTTKVGGNGECGGSGCGVVFELSPQPDGSWTESVLYVFCSLSNCADGEEPIAGPLVRDAAGNLYGTTYFGGAYRNCNGDGCGVVFKLDTTLKETVLHNFTGGADGAFPWAGLTMDSAGNLYGVAEAGGRYQVLRALRVRGRIQDHSLAFFRCSQPHPWRATLPPVLGEHTQPIVGTARARYPQTCAAAPRSALHVIPRTSGSEWR